MLLHQKYIPPARSCRHVVFEAVSKPDILVSSWEYFKKYARKVHTLRICASDGTAEIYRKFNAFQPTLFPNLEALSLLWYNVSFPIRGSCRDYFAMTLRAVMLSFDTERLHHRSVTDTVEDIAMLKQLAGTTLDSNADSPTRIFCHLLSQSPVKTLRIYFDTMPEECLLGVGPSVTGVSIAGDAITPQQFPRYDLVPQTTRVITSPHSGARPGLRRT
ncbi:hypothetical protein F5I97DRAFT_1970191 [Phlebopus sp. FC_14]|nr:hypothetical protein F5I97DRAFT_1970191 [Phlebopus sp. FC_14]